MKLRNDIGLDYSQGHYQRPNLLSYNIQPGLHFGGAQADTM